MASSALLGLLLLVFSSVSGSSASGRSISGLLDSLAKAPSNQAKQFMKPQNAARAKLGLPPLVWDSRLEAYAKWWADQRKRYGDCSLQHSNTNYGENIFWGSGKNWSPKEAAQAWVDERRYYNYKQNTCAGGRDCGHYTQIVWRSSSRIGCAKVTCPSGNIFITCNYDPPGNYINERPY